jgi:transcriptional regulator with XRE-family HTH domain
MSVAQLSRKAAVPKNTLFNWLSGLKPKDVVQVKRVAEVLGVSLDYLLFGVQPTAAIQFSDYQDEINAGVFEVVLRRR